MSSAVYPAGAEGFPLLSITTPECMTLPAYFADKDILFISSYPKSGTTWMQNIIASMLLGAERYDKCVEHISDFTPFLESPKTHSRIGDFYTKFDSFSCFNTHLLCDIHLPNSMWRAKGEDGVVETTSKKCYLIYCVRNMKDVIVSFYHHLSSQLTGDDCAANLTFKEFLLQFVSGGLPYGCYLKHLQYHRELSIENGSGSGTGSVSGGILLVRYEDMVRDLSSSVKTVASHLHLPLSELEVQALAARNSFAYMAERQEKFSPKSVEWRQDSGFRFVRKGVLGDHVNYFDAECDAICDEYVNSYFGGVDAVPRWFRDFQEYPEGYK